MKASDNPYPSLLLVEQPTAPADLPASGQKRIYISNVDNQFYSEDSSGTVTSITPGATGASGPAGATGVAGATGSTGPTGSSGVGSTGATGPVGIHWQGNWNSITTYALNDIVLYSDGTVYISLVTSNLNHIPSATTGTDWDILVSEGATGSIGVAGASGASGSAGINGATGATGPAGASGSAGGATGATGSSGSAGTNGATGSTGPAGSSGSPGGATGATGAIGATGPGGSGGTVPTSGWTAVNGIFYNDFLTPEILSFFQPTSGGLAWGFVQQSLPGIPYDFSCSIRFTQNNTLNNSAGDIGVYITDGTKLIGLEVLELANSTPALRVERMNSVSSDAGTVAGPTGNIMALSVFSLRITNDSTNRTFYYWNAGSWVQFYQEATGSFLTETAVGVGGLTESSNPVVYVSGEVISWSLTT